MISNAQIILIHHCSKNVHGTLLGRTRIYSYLHLCNLCLHSQLQM